MTLSGSSVYRAEDRRLDDRDRDRSPLRSEERCESDNQSDAKRQKLTFGFGKKTSNEQKKGIQIKLGSVSVSDAFSDSDTLQKRACSLHNTSLLTKYFSPH